MIPGGFGRPSFIFPFHPDQFHNIQQVIQGIGSVPELMLTPQSCGYRQKKEFVHVRAFGNQEPGIMGREAEPPPPKKPSSVQTTSSIVSFRQIPGSYCSSG